MLKALKTILLSPVWWGAILTVGWLWLTGQAHSQGVQTQFTTSNYYNGALSSTAVQIKGGPGVVAGIYCANPASNAISYVQVFDSYATPNVGTTTPNGSFGVNAAAASTVTVLNLDRNAAGFSFSNGLWIAATTTPAGSTAPSTALICNIQYQ
jgi:hypothetical protein